MGYFGLMVSNVAAHHASRSPGIALGERWRDSRAFACAAAIAYGFAGLLVPIVGWFIGLAMVAKSSQWSARQKRVCAAVPMSLVLIVVAATSFVTALHVEPERHWLVAHLPSGYDVAWIGVVIVMVVSASIGVWLMHSMRD